jgi:hypothetical protein
MFLLWRLAKLCLKLALALALAFVAFVAWGNFWPAPSHAPRIDCPARSYDPCRTISGRVLYHTSFGPGRRAHVVLMSRSSITLPGITSLEFPRLRSAPAGISVGDWISVTGQRKIGSHGEHDFHVKAFATAKVAMRCGNPVERFPCRSVTLGAPHAERQRGGRGR